MNEIALFESALRAAVPVRPDLRVKETLVPRLAQLARAATLDAETQASRRVTAPGGGVRSRRALVARVAIAVGLIPLIVAGLAFAGVTVPATARHAFESVGITLPNQPSGQSHSASSQSRKPPATVKSPSSTSGNDVSTAAHTKAKGKGGNSTAAHEHALNQRTKAHGEALGHSRGKAIGLNQVAPPSHSVQTGPPAHSNAGGSPQSHAVRSTPTPHPQPSPPALPPQANGQARGPQK
jgi:hypothetical protein